jgi:hypothetical protein
MIYSDFVEVSQVIPGSSERADRTRPWWLPTRGPAERSKPLNRQALNVP